MTAFFSERTSSLPPPPPGWFDYGQALLSDGNLALLRTDFDFRAAYVSWRDGARDGISTRVAPVIDGNALRVSVFDGATEVEAFRIESPAFPMIDRFPDGRWLLVSARAGIDESNGRILDRDGTPRTNLIAGEGIESLACAPDGTFWIGYFDEGIFGGPARDGRWPVSSAGLAHFSAGGDPIWLFNSENGRELFIDDCYAFSLSGNMAWACTYSHFPISRIEDGRVAFWSNDVAGAHAIAVEDDLVLLAGGYGPDSDRLALVRLEGLRARLVGETRLPACPTSSTRLLQGRDNVLHLVQDGGWTRIAVDDVRRHFGA